MTSSLARKLEELVGRGKVFSSDAELLCYSYDATPLVSHRPEAVVRVTSEQDIAAVLELAAQEGLPVTPRGSGTGLSGGSVPVKGGIVLLTTAMNRIIEIDADDLSVTVEPGVITADLHAAVEELGLFYPPDPGSMKVSTIGGNVAENAGGLRGLKYGITADYLLSLDSFLIDGSKVHYGTKCVKDVAGYNLIKFLAGTEGTIGFFSKMVLKLIPKPRTKKTFLAVYDDVLDAARTVSALIARRIIPSTLELMDSVTINCVEDHVHIGLPRDVAALLRSLDAAEFVPLPSADRCCGFGGTFMAKMPEISMALADEKLDTILSTGADTVTGCDHGCLMNISDAIRRRGAAVQAKHIAVVLAEGLA